MIFMSAHVFPYLSTRWQLVDKESVKTLCIDRKSQSREGKCLLVVDL